MPKIIKKMNVAAGIIVKKDWDDTKRVLLIRRSPTDHWKLHYEVPRGKCDFGKKENLIHCLKREVKEETGLDIIPIHFIDKFTYTADKGTRQSTQYNFLCHMKDPNQEIKLSFEHDDYKWISSMGEAELNLLPELKVTISKILNQDVSSIVYKNNPLQNTNIEESFKNDKEVSQMLREQKLKMVDLILDGNYQKFNEGSTIIDSVLNFLSENDTYKEYFQKMMDDAGIKSIGDLSDEEKKKFFSKVDAGWKSKDETVNESVYLSESVSSEVSKIYKLCVKQMKGSDPDYKLICRIKSNSAAPALIRKEMTLCNRFDAPDKVAKCKKSNQLLFANYQKSAILQKDQLKLKRSKRS